MKRLISATLAGNILLIFLGLLVIFHILAFFAFRLAIEKQ